MKISTSRYKKLDPNKIFFISDPHLGHAKVIEYDNRPFKDLDDMHTQIIANWNSVIGKTDLVFINGDFALSTVEDVIHWCSQLNGRKVLIPGNHDYRWLSKYKTHMTAFEYIMPQMEITVNDPDLDRAQHITLSHYAMLTWPNSHRESWQLFAHSHGKLNGDPRLSPRQIDMYCGDHGYTPWSYYEIKEQIIKQIQNSKL